MVQCMYGSHVFEDIILHIHIYITSDNQIRTERLARLTEYVHSLASCYRTNYSLTDARLGPVCQIEEFPSLAVCC